MKNAVPGTSKISKEAKDAVQECVSEFISFITSEAAEKCHEEKRKTIGGEDVLYAMMMLGFEQYVEPLKIYLSKMRQVRPPVVLPSSTHTAVFNVWRRSSDPSYTAGTDSARNSLPEVTRPVWVMGLCLLMKKPRRL
jgi:histone H3/H4